MKIKFLFSVCPLQKKYLLLIFYSFIEVKQAASDASYTAIIIVGGVALLAMFYYLFSELFSRETPTGIYEESSKFCTRNTEVILKQNKRSRPIYF